MKTMRFVRPLQASQIAVCLLFTTAGRSLADGTGTGPGSGANPTNSIIPVVTIEATRSNATWLGTAGIFTVSRHGNPAPPLDVYYGISGTASNGVDYQTIGNFVSIPSGVYSNDIVIKPINKGQAVTKTVTLALTDSPLARPVNYGIGSPSNATVNIGLGPATNLPPAVSIVAPTNGSTFYTPVNLPILACAKDPDGFVVSVEFFAGTNELGTVTNPITILPPLASAGPSLPPMPPYRPFVLVWSNVPPGTNVLLTAIATDNGGASIRSDPVSITVHPGPPPPPPTNLPPVVRITSPPEGATFRAPVNIPITAFAADPDGYVTAVEFFAGTNDLGPGHRLTPPTVAGTPPIPPILLSNLWGLVWSNATQGFYASTAVAADNGGASTVSDPVNITILPPVPPPTPTNVVNIVALDPVAIEGTNCWPWLGLAAASPEWANWTASAAVCRYFTNCGPKDALFAVRRLGTTNSDLSVTYDIGGTASNGVDYVTLPGVVTIPAGERVALIPLVPLDDGPPDITSTVILKLTPSAGYIVGRPASAAAIILDPPAPRAVTAVLPDRCFHLSAPGPNSAWCHIEYTTDLLHWTPICTNQVFQGAIDFVDPDAPSDQVRFYRAVPEDGAPSE